MDLFEKNFIENYEEERLHDGPGKLSDLLPFIFLFLLVLSYLFPFH